MKSMPYIDPILLPVELRRRWISSWAATVGAGAATQSLIKLSLRGVGLGLRCCSCKYTIPACLAFRPSYTNIAMHPSTHARMHACMRPLPLWLFRVIPPQYAPAFKKGGIS